MQHLDEGTIHAWLDGALAPGQSVRVERHAAECARCAERVAEARGLIAAASTIVSSLDVVRGVVLPASSGARLRGSLWRALHLTPARAALAATLLVAVASMLTRRNAGAPVAAHRLENANIAPKAAALAPAPTAPAPARKQMPPPSRHITPPLAQVAPAPSVAPLTPTHESAPATAVTSVDTASVAAKESTVRAALARPIGDGALRLSEVVATSANRPVGVEGCYAIRGGDSTRDRAVPERFALERPNLVRVVNANAERDTVIRGATWRSLGPMAALVDFPNARGGPIRIGVAAPSMGANFAEPRARGPRVERAECKP